MAKNAGSFIKGILLGALAGAFAVVLLAPKSGEETRKDIKKFAGEMKEKLTDIYNEARKEVKRRAKQLEKAGEKIDEGKYKVLVAEVVEEFKKDAVVTSSVAQKLSEQLKADWSIVKEELDK